MKKIMIMTNNLVGGGAEKVLQTLVNNLDKEKYNITLYSLHYNIENLELFSSQIHYRYIFGYQKKNFLHDVFFNILDKIKGKLFIALPPSIFYRMYIKGKYDVEIAFIEGESTKIISGSPNNRSKKYAWVHIDLINNPWTKVVYKTTEEEKQCYKKFDKVFCVSSNVKEAFDKKYNTHNSFVQYNPVDEKEIIDKSKERNIEKQADLQLVTLGRLVPQKGYDRLLECVKKLKDNGYKDYNIWILGDGEQKEKLEKYIKINNLSDYVTLLGFKENPYPYIAASDGFICSSRSEGFSTVATESLILGKPIYTVNCAGMKELFGEYNCGMIVENDDVQLYKMMIKIITNKEIANNYAKNIEKRKRFFTLTKRLNEIKIILDN